MEPRALVHRLVGSTETSTESETIRLTRALRKDGSKPGELAQHCSVSRSTVYRQLDPLVDCGLLYRDDGKYSVTGGSELLLRDYDWAMETIGRDALAYLAGSTHRAGLLKTLKTEPLRSRELVGDSVSKSTVRRALRGFEERNWVVRTTSGAYTTTSNGDEAIMTFLQLLETAEQTQAKAPFLRRFGQRSLDIPRGILSESDLVVSTGQEPHAALNAVIDLTNLREAHQGTRKLRDVRTVVPIFSAVMYDVFGSLVDSGTQMQIIFDQESYREMRTPANAHYLAGAFLAPNLDVRIHPESLTFGFGYYDGAAMVAAYSEREDHDAGIVSEDDQFVEWVVKTIDDLWEEADSPTQYAVDGIRSALEDSELRSRLADLQDVVRR